MSSRFGSKTDGGIIRDFIESYDGDAANYFAVNTAIVSEADKRAINTFYLGLKSDGIYTKITAMYLPLWSSATNNKWNLKNPLDTNGAYRLTFSTGWTHSSSGMTPNGSSAFADSFLTTSVIGLNSGHLSYYSRTNSTGAYGEMGALRSIPNSYTDLGINNSSLPGAYVRFNNGGNVTGIANSNSTGFYINSRTASNVIKLFKNGAVYQSLTDIANSTDSTRNIYIGAINNQGTAINFSNRQCSFASIGTGLTDTEAKNFSNRVNTLLAYFGINTYPVVSDADAQAYINANDAITSQSDANAINTFFTGLKSDGVYSKIKAMYLPIWGSASASKWNLVNPLDTDAAYRATFTTGITYSSSGILFNGTSSYMDTKFVPSTGFTSINASGFSFYQRTNNTDTSNHGIIATSTNDRFYFAPQSTYYQIQGTESGSTYWNTYVNTDRKGFYTNSRRANNDRETYKNGVSKATNTANDTGAALSSINFYIGAANGPFIGSTYSANQISFACLDTGLTDTEATNFYNRVNTLMTYFGINV